MMDSFEEICREVYVKSTFKNEGEIKFRQLSDIVPIRNDINSNNNSQTMYNIF